MSINEELEKLLNVYNQVILPTAFDDSQSYYETLGRINYVITQLEKQGRRDYTADFQKILTDITSERPVLEGQISTETNEETEAMGKVTTALNDEIQRRKDADAALQAEVEATVNNLSNIGINRGVILVTQPGIEATAIADGLKRATHATYAVESELSNAANAIAGLTIQDPREITDIVFLGLPDNVVTASSSTAAVITYMKQAFPNAIAYLQPFTKTPLADINKRDAMKTACEQGAYYLGCSYMSFEEKPECVVQEILTGKTDYAIDTFYRTTKTGSTETDEFLAIKFTARPAGFFAKLTATNSDNTEKAGVVFADSGSYDYVKTRDLGITEELHFFEPTGRNYEVILKTDKVEANIRTQYSPTATQFIIL